MGRPLHTNDALCNSSLERAKWDGDQILYEIRMPGSDTLSAAQLERDTTTIIGAAFAPYGRVAYTYGLQLDAPLSIIRMGYTFASIVMGPSPGTYFHDFYGATAVFPHQNWRGAYDIGTFADGLGMPDGMDARCKVAPNYYAYCVEVNWPASNTGFFGVQYSAQTTGNPWMGGQIDGRRDASGLLYMRNRYYDPRTARFTQEDPIGLAGGLNLYGYAAGDPVSYSDPFGLKICFIGTAVQVAHLVAALENATGTDITLTQGCISAIQNRGGDPELQARLYHMAFTVRRITNVQFLTNFRDTEAQILAGEGNVDDAWYGTDRYGGPNVTGVGSGWARVTYPTRTWLGGRCFPLGGRQAQNIEGILVHELLGHGYVSSLNNWKKTPEGPAIAAENRYLRRAGRPQRTGYC